MTLQNYVKKFLEITQMPKSAFCKNVDISNTTLFLWLRNERDLNISTENRIIDFMQNYVKKLVELAS